MKWISIKDRLPEHRKLVLVLTNAYAQAVTIFLKDEFTTQFLKDHGVNIPDDCLHGDGYAFCSQENRGNILNGITHWMPLPEPPNEK